MDARRTQRKAAERKAGVQAGVAFFVLCGVGVAVAVWVTKAVPGWDWLFDGRHSLGELVVVPVVVIPLLYLCGGPLYRALERRAIRLAGPLPPASPTPAQRWAESNGWDYRDSDDDFDQSVWQAAFDVDLDEATEIVHGQYLGRESWAFVFEGGNGKMRSTGEAVVLQLRTPWDGQFETSRTKKLVSTFGGDIRSVGGWFVDGDLDGGTAAIVDLLQQTGIASALAASRLPADTLIRVQAIPGRYAAAVVDWAPFPDLILPPALELLTLIASRLESDLTGEPVD